MPSSTKRQAQLMKPHFSSNWILVRFGYILEREKFCSEHRKLELSTKSVREDTVNDLTTNVPKCPINAIKTSRACTNFRNPHEKLALDSGE